MIIAELIKELQKHPPELRVLVTSVDDEGSWLEDLSSICVEPVRKSFGDYYPCKEEDKEETALTIY